MKNIRRFTNEEIEMANNKSILEYIKLSNLETIKAGKTIKVKGYGGLYIDPLNNRWNCFSERKGGGIIQLVMFLENKTWVESVKGLLGKENEIKTFHKNKNTYKEVRKEFILPKKNSTFNHAIAYLIKTRKINKDIVYKFIKNKTLYEDVKRNCVFIGNDESGNPKYAGIRGTNTDVPFKGEIEGSNKAFSFNLKGNSNSIYVFESPIELMSYLTLNRELEDKDYFLSLGCLAPVALEKYLSNNKEIENISLCLNNDKWGRKASKEIKELFDKEYKVSIELPNLKDWNDELVNLKTKAIEDEWEMEV